MSKYEVNDKFIIEIAEVCTTDRRKSTEEGHTLYRVKGFNSLVFDDNGLDKLKKCEQPTISEDTLEMERMKVLNDGRNEVWELANKIFDMDYHTTDEVFGCDTCEVMKMSPQEALAKLEAYEKKQNEIKVGDVVTTINGECGYIVTNIQLPNTLHCINSRNGYALQMKISSVKKTGKHIDIKSVLQQIGE